MILQALTAYYDALVERGDLPAPGWDSAFKVSYGLVLGPDGSLADVLPLLTEAERGKKKVLVPAVMKVPAHSTRTAGIKPAFLCDNSAYLLGADAKGNPARAKACFDAAAALHHRLLDDADSPAAKAILAFFDRWNPDEAPGHPRLAPFWKEIAAGANLLFYTDGDLRPVTGDPAVADAWNRHYNAPGDDLAPGRCLVTGQIGPIARIHPTVKGVRGAQSSGAALVSFNAPAFNSYGHEQGGNAPVGSRAAFAYTTALNTLLADRDHCFLMGDTVALCWAESAQPAYTDLFWGMMGMTPGLSDAAVTGAVKALSRGRPYDWDGVTLQPGEHFYLLGLAPNAARLSVRFFLRDRFGGFARHIEAHYSALEIVRPAFDARVRLSVGALLREATNLNATHPAPPPQLVGSLLTAILTGGRYPATLLNAVTLRIRADREVNRGRAAILKAYYLRNENEKCPKEVLTVEVNEQTTYAPYVMGRLFAVLEMVQRTASPTINTTIKDRYFNAASATPAVIFPLLINLTQKHLVKLPTPSQIYYDKMITGIVGLMGQTFPNRLSLPEQGAFQIGYYHQMQKLFTAKEDKNNG